MKRYRITDKHPAYKEGLILKGEVLIGSTNKEWKLISFVQRKKWIKKRWIEEIQEFEFTENDMINFTNWINSTDKNYNPITNEDLHYWKIDNFIT